VQVNLSFVQPRPTLRPYVRSLHVFESEIGIPLGDRSLVAPNGCSKIIIPYENSLEFRPNGCLQIGKEQGLYFIGTRDTPVRIHASLRRTGFVWMDFQPHGAFALFGIPMRETTGRMLEGDVIFGTRYREIRETLCNLQTVSQKTDFLQDELVGLLGKNKRDGRLIGFSVRALEVTRGQLPINELTRLTGVTRRHLDQIFQVHVGLSPKVLASIFRFQKFYQKWAKGLSYEAIQEGLYDHYYDQAHFIKEFKRMTGYPPRRFLLEVPNQFGRLCLQ